MKRARGPLLVSTEEAIAYMRGYLGITVLNEEQLQKRIYNWVQADKLTNYGHSGKGGARWALKEIHNLASEALDNEAKVRSSTKRRR